MAAREGGRRSGELDTEFMTTPRRRRLRGRMERGGGLGIGGGLTGLEDGSGNDVVWLSDIDVAADCLRTVRVERFLDRGMVGFAFVLAAASLSIVVCLPAIATSCQPLRRCTALFVLPKVVQDNSCSAGKRLIYTRTHIATSAMETVGQYPSYSSSEDLFAAESAMMGMEGHIPLPLS